jgi:molybdopterin converting factor small subunit
LRVRIVPYAELRHRLLPDGGDTLLIGLADDANVGDALRLLEVQDHAQLIVGLNGEYATPDTPLRDGAELVLVTPMEGG